MTKRKDHIYFIRIGDISENLYKIGTTNNIARRIKEHERYYKKSITLLWLSPAYSKYTTLRVEDKTISMWKNMEGFKYIRNDRFIIDPKINKVVITVRKEWTVEF